MQDNVFQVELGQKTEKCLVAVAEPNGRCCNGCGKPRPILAGGLCTSCAVEQGLNPLRPAYLLKTAG